MMKRFRFLLVLSFSGFVLLSCSTDREYEPVVYNDASISLNNGDKWLVPAQMKVFIDSSFTLINNLKDDKDISDEMIQELIRHKNGFISNCNMEGKGHDVLHEWLMPYLDILELASESHSTERLRQVKAELIDAGRIFEENFK